MALEQRVMRSLHRRELAGMLWTLGWRDAEGAVESQLFRKIAANA